ncbi:MAG: UDP-N-acetylmuramoylalanyl-D-glutamyl-2,6-diaminopimelate--D-alanyl-D-alanine ligase [Parvibaculaceae bacterium]
MTPLWTPEELVAASGGRLEGELRVPVGGVSIDTRTLQPGDLFVAIRGEQHDAHDFAAKALGAGASAAVVSRTDEAMRKAGPLLVVDDPLKALERLGVAARARAGGRMIAVTGSVGKTTTKDALKLALDPSGATHASAASYNNHWGVPLTLARMPRAAAFGVFEIGMNHAGEITPLVRMARPHVAVVTAIAESHLGQFSSLAEIADAKAEIFLGVEAGGAAVVNRDSEFFDRLAKAARTAGIDTIVGFGENAGAEVRLVCTKLHAECSCVRAEVFGEKVEYKLGMPGRHVVMNSLAVLAAAKLAGADLARAALALSRLQPPKGRGVRTVLPVRGGSITLIDESYNANPTSMRAALSLLGQIEPGSGGRRIAVLGDMLELGDEAEAFHAGLAPVLKSVGTDAVFACGPNMRHLMEAMPAERRGAYAETSGDLEGPLLAALRKGDVVMVKGSLGSRMGPLVDAIRERYGKH